MRIVAMSDTHNLHRSVSVPDGDVLVHAGDLTNRGDLADVADFNAWLGDLPHRHKLVIAGNHDFCFERTPREAKALLTAATYLLDSGVTIDGVHFYGSPWQPWFFDWAFNLPRGGALAAKWALIPPQTDVLITHTPPQGIGDVTAVENEAVGCEALRPVVAALAPRLHVFGHIHEGYGVVEKAGVIYANASVVTLDYRPVNPPLIFDL